MTETGLIRYDAMCHAIAEARAVDEVKDVRDKARALELYYAQAKNRDAEVQAAEIRNRAETRCGELIREQQQAGELARPKAGGDQKSTSRRTTSKTRHRHQPRPVEQVSAAGRHPR
jgi:hypothetical protein